MITIDQTLRAVVGHSLMELRAKKGDLAALQAFFTLHPSFDDFVAEERNTEFQRLVYALAATRLRTVDKWHGLANDDHEALVFVVRRRVERKLSRTASTDELAGEIATLAWAQIEPELMPHTSEAVLS